jgi:predicted PurR-regulated permease PerM
MMSETWQRALFWFGAILVCGFALWLLSGILLPFAVGCSVAYFLDPLCDRLERLRLPRGAAALIVLVGFLLGVALIVLVLVPLLETQIIDLVHRFPKFMAAARGYANSMTGFFQERLSAEDYGKLRDAVGAKLGEAFSWIGKLLEGVVGGGLALFNILSLVFITPIVAFFLLRDWDRIVARVDSWLPRPHVETIRGQARLVDQTLAGFIRGQATVCALMAVFYAAALSLAGLDFGLVIGLLVGIFIFIPFIGGTIGAVLAILLAIAQFSDWTSIAIIAGIFVIGQTIEGNVLTPKLVGERVNLHPVWVIFSLLAFGNLFGLAGLLIAVPVAATLGVLTRFALGRYLASPIYDPAAASARDDETIRL